MDAFELTDRYVASRTVTPAHVPGHLVESSWYSTATAALRVTLLTAGFAHSAPFPSQLGFRHFTVSSRLVDCPLHWTSTHSFIDRSRKEV